MGKRHTSEEGAMTGRKPKVVKIGVLGMDNEENIMDAIKRAGDRGRKRK